MVDKAIERVEVLIAEGESFSYDNFAPKSTYGYPSGLSPKWAAWTTRVAGAMVALFGDGSAPLRLVQSASIVKVLGNGPEKFEHSKSLYLGALEAAKEALLEDTFGELIQHENAIAGQSLSNRVFVVHGRDDFAKNELDLILKEFGLEPVVLHRQADGGRTLIEKFEEYADVGFAFILLTPDEYAYLAEDQEKPESERRTEVRARPNVIFEFGYFVGRLGRKRTCCLYKGDVQLPSDLDGIVYKRFERSPEEVGLAIRRELVAAGYKLP